MDGIGKLGDRALPPQEAVYSRLKNENTFSVRQCGVTNVCSRCVTFSCDVTTATSTLSRSHRQTACLLQTAKHRYVQRWRKRPGTGIALSLNELPSNTFFTVFNQTTNSDLHLLVKDNIIGGLAIICHRYHKKDVTKIRGEETCTFIVRYDANALYLWALMQEMPT